MLVKEETTIRSDQYKANEFTDRDDEEANVEVSKEGRKNYSIIQFVVLLPYREIESVYGREGGNQSECPEINGRRSVHRRLCFLSSRRLCDKNGHLNRK